MHFQFFRECLLCCYIVTWLASPDCNSLSIPGEAHSDKEQIIPYGQIPKHVGDKHSGFVSLTGSYFLCVGGIPDLRILHPDCLDVFFFLIKTTQLMIKRNTSLTSILQKARGQNLTSAGIGEDPTATIVFCCQVGPRAPPEQLSLGFWSTEAKQMCLPANALPTY
jgi:hypothetical protein